MKLPGFVGPTYQDQSVSFDVQRAMNWIPEQSGSGTSRNVSAFYPTPGLKKFVSLPDGPIRGLFANAGRLYAASGQTLYEVHNDQTFTTLGFLAFSNQLVLPADPVLMMHNGSQMGIITGGYFQLFDGSTVTAPQWNDGSVNSDGTSNIPACYGTFIDGYFVVVLSSLPFLTKVFQLSDLAPADPGFPNGLGGLGGLNWTPQIDAAAKEGSPDALAAVFADHEDLWLLGCGNSTEVWRDTGAANFPFQRDPGAFIHYGCAAPFSVTRLNNGIAWLAGDTARGGPIAVYAQGYLPQRVSTHAIEYAWQQYPKWSDVVAYSYIDKGHHFWVLNFPSGNATWVYDASTNLWHERGHYTPNWNQWDQHIARYHAYVDLSEGENLSGRHFVGDYRNSNIYVMSSTYYDDNGTPIFRSRTCPAISDEEKQISYFRVQLDMEGIGARPFLDWSVDHGHTFKPFPALWSSLGTETAAADALNVLGQGPPPGIISANSGPGSRVIWRRLGKSRYRAFRFTTGDPVFHALINAYVDTSEAGS